MENKNAYEVFKVKADDLLKDKTYQVRTVDPEIAEAIASDIKTHGQLQPVIARKSKNDNLQLIAGWHRVQACQIAEMSVDVRIINCTEKESLIMAYAENTHKMEFSGYDRYRAVTRLESEDFTVEEISRTLVISVPRVYEISKINEYPKLVEELKNGTLSLQQAAITAKGLNAVKISPSSGTIDRVTTAVQDFGKVPTYDTVKSLILQNDSKANLQLNLDAMKFKRIKPTSVVLVYGPNTNRAKLQEMLDKAKKAVAELEILVEAAKPANKRPAVDLDSRSKTSNN